MNYGQIYIMLQAFGEANGVDVSYFEFDASPETESYIAWFEEASDVLGADNKVWFSAQHWRVELYTPRKLPDLETKLTECFDENSVYWQKDDQIHIEDEQMFLTIFHI